MNEISVLSSHLLTTCEAAWYSVVPVCLSVCQMITFEILHVGSLYLHIRCIFRKQGRLCPLKAMEQVPPRSFFSLPSIPPIPWPRLLSSILRPRKELDPCSLEIYRMCKYELPTSRLSKIIVWQTDRPTRPKLYTTPLRGWSIMSATGSSYQYYWQVTMNVAC